MTSEHYRQILNNSYKEQDLTQEDFDNTLMYFAMLITKEQKPKYDFKKFDEVQYCKYSRPSEGEYILTSAIYDGKKLTDNELEDVMDDSELNYELYTFKD